MTDEKNRTMHALLFAIPGLLFLFSGYRLYAGNDSTGMVIHGIAGLCFLIIAFAKFRGWFS